ncbi:MAG TPA: ATP-binding protein [Thermoanaerobaculia bacterium]
MGEVSTPAATIPLPDTVFRELVENSLIGTLMVEDEQIVYASPRCAEIFARPLETVVGMRVDAIVHPDDWKTGNQQLRQRMIGSDLSVFYSFRAVRPDGSLRDLETQTVWRTIDGRKTAVISVIDVTRRNERVRKALEIMVDEWRRTFDAVDTPIVITKSDGTVVRANRAACELSGLREFEIIGKNIARMGIDEPWRSASQMLSTEARDGNGRTWDINIARFDDARDRSERCILVFWNISGTVELQESLRRSETMSAMGKIVAGVAHEVRNPLFGISATLDAFADELSRPGYTECAAALTGEVQRLTSLMQDLLEYGKPSALHIEHANLSEIIDEVVQHESESPVLVESRVPKDLPLLFVDRSRIRQVFVNLIQNAGQHAPAGSVVRVTGAFIEQSGRPWVECRVEDSGTGFNAEDIDRVFDPFFTRREAGTGLGLSIVQRIVHDHSGRVFAGNRPEGGAVVRILFPIADDEES